MHGKAKDIYEGFGSSFMGVKAKAAAILVLLILFLSPVYAQGEAPTYNFGTMQAEKAVNIEPGESHTAKIYVYNIYGNRITHVRFSVVEAPEGWDIELEPELHTVTTNISGELVTVEENLFAEPTSTVAQPPDLIPEGMEYLQAGDVEGLIPSKVLKVIITPPKSAPLGGTHKITVNAKATWLGQGGMVVLSQDRNFDFTVRTMQEKFTEEIVVQTEAPVESGEGGQSPLKFVAMGAGAAILILLILGYIVVALKKD